MFRIGEFSQIARVSARLLRYYDGLGLLRPQRIDPQTGYRFYSAQQLPRLNRILALKDLGLALDQVARFVDDDISTEEIRRMLTLKKAEVEAELREGQDRLRRIEARLRQIDEGDGSRSFDVLLKPVAAQPFIALRGRFAGMDPVIATLRALTARIPEASRDKLVVLAHSDFDDEELDLEIGFSLNRAINRRVSLADGRELSLSELPAVPSMAAIVRRDTDLDGHRAFGALGQWIEANGFSICGPCREVFLESPFQGGDMVVEIQFPVERTGTTPG
ncbi:MAG: MerR family transcriptional regulator [Alphaproteobacteria bacterium]|nr:MerR family transcriptional regulator [Alphaproteobacteria bacterium]